VRDVRLRDARQSPTERAFNEIAFSETPCPGRASTSFQRLSQDDVDGRTSPAMTVDMPPLVAR